MPSEEEVEQAFEWARPKANFLIAELTLPISDRRTLVLATAEFGRTPKVNPAGGRDHWPWVYSVALAGGGTAPGVVYGASDGIAAHPTAHPHDPRDGVSVRDGAAAEHNQIVRAGGEVRAVHREGEA